MVKLTKAQMAWLEHASKNWCGKGSISNRTAISLETLGLCRRFWRYGIGYWEITPAGRNVMRLRTGTPSLPSQGPPMTLTDEQISDGWKLHDGGNNPFRLMTPIQIITTSGGKLLRYSDECQWTDNGRPYVASYRSLSPDRPEPGPVAWRMYDKQSAEIWGKPSWSIAWSEADLPPESIRQHYHIEPLFTRPSGRLEWGEKGELLLNGKKIGSVLYIGTGTIGCSLLGQIVHKTKGEIDDAKDALMAKARQWLGV